MDPEYNRSPSRRVYTVEQAVDIGLDLEFLQNYYAASRSYFHARMGMNQNRPFIRDPSDELLQMFKDDIERIRKYRYKAAKDARHRAWSDLAVLRKKTRAALGHE
jgi:hypothetical protein